MLRTFHEWLVYIPLGVGADLSRPYMFVVVSWLGIRCVRVCLCRLVADLFAICGMAMCVHNCSYIFVFCFYYECATMLYAIDGFTYV